MYIYDISRDIVSAEVYDGDPETQVNLIKDMAKGDRYNLSSVSMCTHAATHIDAPLHFDEQGESVDRLRLSTFYGKCTVISFQGIFTGADMEKLLPKCKKRLLIHGEGNAFLSVSAAEVLADSNMLLVGTDGLSIAADFDEDRVHRCLCTGKIAILEGLDLSNISDGEYTLAAFPIKLSGLEAAPCRAILLQQERGI